jgi:hypothetical protein
MGGAPGNAKLSQKRVFCRLISGLVCCLLKENMYPVNEL